MFWNKKLQLQNVPCNLPTKAIRKLQIYWHFLLRATLFRFFVRKPGTHQSNTEILLSGQI